MTDLRHAIHESVINEKNAEIERLRATLAQPHMVWAAEQHSVGVDIAAEDARLRTRQQELLATIARISQSTPLDSEVAEALEQRGVMLARIGTLESKCEELSQRVQDTLAAWTDDLNKRVAPFVAIVEEAKAWRDATSGMTTLNKSERVLAAAIDAARGKL